MLGVHSPAQASLTLAWTLSPVSYPPSSLQSMSSQPGLTPPLPSHSPLLFPSPHSSTSSALHLTLSGLFPVLSLTPQPHAQKTHFLEILYRVFSFSALPSLCPRPRALLPPFAWRTATFPALRDQGSRKPFLGPWARSRPPHLPPEPLFVLFEHPQFWCHSHLSTFSTKAPCPFLPYLLDREAFRGRNKVHSTVCAPCQPESAGGSRTMCAHLLGTESSDLKSQPSVPRLCPSSFSRPHCLSPFCAVGGWWAGGKE